ncbi:hypothetical protein RvY_00385 [Ramazzottius varieornatus]|uniref:UV excision repair protein RAD23 n=1 Tax=Ramazzottius varieornatus TaxID=947166 RepID=A0A1D1UGP3_RAMVA|nr:hypothetical protein RvY_00385 [Ramazzottius varieornatus]
MQVNCRLISQETFTIPAEPTTTVAELKKKIEDVKGENFKADLLKLIYAGRVLDNNQATLESIKFVETGFIVVMAAKAKPSTKPTDSSARPTASTSTTSSTPTTAATAPAPAPVSTASSTTIQASQPPSAQAAATQIHGAFGKTPAEIGAMVDAIVEMGYPRGEAEQALRASFYNPERAVEYLISGIPAGISGGPSLSPPSGAQAAQGNAPAQPQGGGGAQHNDPLANFRNSAQFAMMRQMIQQDPALLPQFVESIGQSNPALLNAIRDNQEAFLAMLNNEEGMEDEEDLEGEDWQANIAEALQAQGIDPAPLGGLGGLGGAGAAQGGGGGGGVGPNAQYVNVTAEEMAAIERLKALGFPEQVVIQAYLACDKNEEMAANLLFSGLDE